MGLKEDPVYGGLLRPATILDVPYDFCFINGAIAIGLNMLLDDWRMLLLVGPLHLLAYLVSYEDVHQFAILRKWLFLRPSLWPSRWQQGNTYSECTRGQH